MNPLIIIGNRQTGKTTQIIYAMKKDDILVVANHQMKRIIMEKFGIPEDFIITHDEFIDGKKLKKIKSTNIYIDDAEWLLHKYLGKHTLRGMVITLEQPQN